MTVFDHNHASFDKKDCVYQEYMAIMEMGKTHKYKDNPLVMQEQMARYKKDLYPEHNGLISGGVLIRRHNDREVVRTMEQW